MALDIPFVIISTDLCGMTNASSLDKRHQLEETVKKLFVYIFAWYITSL